MFSRPDGFGVLRASVIASNMIYPDLEPGH
jgi:hypothetical protein